MIKHTKPFTREVKEEFFIYLRGYLDGIVNNSITGPVMINFDVFRRTKFFKRHHPELVNHKRYEKVVSVWLQEFVKDTQNVKF